MARVRRTQVEVVQAYVRISRAHPEVTIEAQGTLPKRHRQLRDGKAEVLLLGALDEPLLGTDQIEIRVVTALQPDDDDDRQPSTLIGWTDEMTPSGVKLTIIAEAEDFDRIYVLAACSRLKSVELTLTKPRGRSAFVQAASFRAY